MSEFGKIKWQCRRGILELDLLLENYLKTDYCDATDEGRAHFVELLKLEDTELLAVMLEISHAKL